MPNPSEVSPAMTAEGISKIVRTVVRVLLTPIFVACSIFLFIGVVTFLFPMCCLFNLADDEPENIREIWGGFMDFVTSMPRELWGYKS